MNKSNLKEKMSNIKLEIYEKVYHSKISTIYYNIKNGIKNLMIYTPVIWKDRNWDYDYFHILMRFKLSRMEKLHREDGNAEDSEKYADDIKYAINLLDKITEVNYSYMDEAQKPFYERFPNYVPKLEFEKVEDNPKFSRIVDNDTPEQKELLHKCYVVEDKMRKKDLDELYIFLRNHIESWWN